jgi:hypothetical protein
VLIGVGGAADDFGPFPTPFRVVEFRGGGTAEVAFL